MNGGGTFYGWGKSYITHICFTKPHLILYTPDDSIMSTLLKPKYVLFDPAHIRTIHDLDVYHHELLSYVKKGYIIKVRVSYTKVSDSENEEIVNSDIFYSIGYFASAPISTKLENSE